MCKARLARRRASRVKGHTPRGKNICTPVHAKQHTVWYPIPHRGRPSPVSSMMYENGEPVQKNACTQARCPHRAQSHIPCSQYSLSRGIVFCLALVCPALALDTLCAGVLKNSLATRLRSPPF